MNTVERRGDYQRVHRGIRTIKSCYAAPRYTTVGGNCTKRTYNPHFLFMTFLPDTNSEGETNSLFVKGTDQYHSFLVFPLPTGTSPCTASTTVTLCKPWAITRTTIMTVYCNNYQQWRHPHCIRRCLASLTPAETIYTDRFPSPLIISRPPPRTPPFPLVVQGKKNYIYWVSPYALESALLATQPLALVNPHGVKTRYFYCPKIHKASMPLLLPIIRWTLLFTGECVLCVMWYVLFPSCYDSWFAFSTFEVSSMVFCFLPPVSTPFQDCLHLTVTSAVLLAMHNHSLCVFSPPRYHPKYAPYVTLPPGCVSPLPLHPQCPFPPP